MQSPKCVRCYQFQTCHLPNYQDRAGYEADRCHLPRGAAAIRAVFVIPFFFRFLLRFLRVLFSITGVREGVRAIHAGAASEGAGFVSQLVGLSFRRPVSIGGDGFMSAEEVTCR